MITYNDSSLRCKKPGNFGRGLISCNIDAALHGYTTLSLCLGGMAMLTTAVGILHVHHKEWVFNLSNPYSLLPSMDIRRAYDEH